MTPCEHQIIFFAFQKLEMQVVKPGTSLMLSETSWLLSYGDLVSNSIFPFVYHDLLSKCTWMYQLLKYKWCTKEKKKSKKYIHCVFPASNNLLVQLCLTVHHADMISSNICVCLLTLYMSVNERK